ncbi:hypothetical protein M1E17_04035 [Arthrobacter sp. D1-29]
MRRKYGVSTYASKAKADRLWQLCGGVAILSLGVYLTTGPINDGIAGFVGVLCCVFGLASLAGLILGKHRPS